MTPLTARLALDIVVCAALVRVVRSSAGARASHIRDRVWAPASGPVGLALTDAMSALITDEVAW